MLDGKLTGKDDAFSFVTDVEKNLIVVDLDDGALDDVTIIEVFNSGINSSEEVLSSANIVNGYLLSVVSSGHRVGNSGLRNVSGVRE